MRRGQCHGKAQIGTNALMCTPCDIVDLSGRASIHFGVFVRMRRRWVFLHFRSTICRRGWQRGWGVRHVIITDRLMTGADTCWHSVGGRNAFTDRTGVVIFRHHCWFWGTRGRRRRSSSVFGRRKRRVCFLCLASSSTFSVGRCSCVGGWANVVAKGNGRVFAYHVMGESVGERASMNRAAT